MIGLGLSVVQLAVRQLVGGFNPASLFAASEPGVWLDPSDFSTMFQDAAGTTPVTAVGQPVGLMLDKSRGLVLGPELVVNGDFSNGTTGWTLGTGWSVSGGAASGGPATASLYSTNSIGATAGKFYIVTYSITSYTSGTVRANLGANVNGSVRAAIGTYTEYLTPAGGDGRVYFVVSNFSGSIDNISVREIAGNHATQTTSTSRPVLQQDGNGKYYLRFDGVDDWLVTPTITPGTDKVQVFAGVRKLSDGATGILVEFGSSTSSQGSFYLVNEPTSTRYGFAPRGARSAQTNDQASVNGFSSPDTAVLTALSDLNNGTPARLKRNTDAFQNSVNTTFGGGNFLAYPLYIGRRAGTSLPANINLHGLILRFGANLPAATIASTETWINQRTGAF